MMRSTRPTGITLANQDYATGATPRFDLVILTAANSVQAAGYRAQLARRKVEDGSVWDLPCARKAIVVADPKDKRAGSGIATFIALYEAAKYFATLNPKARTLREVFAGRRVLILHSGGDSRRLPAYAAIGKIFVPLPVEDVHGDPRTVFDLVLEDFAALDPGDPATPNLGSITIAAGDVMLNLAKTGINLYPVPGHIVGISARASIETGSRHGVFVTDTKASSAPNSSDTPVRTFLQKPSESLARAAGAIAKDNTVAIDTGVVILDSTTAASWLQSLGASISTTKIKIKAKIKSRTASIRAVGTLAAMCRATAGSIDLYEHILPTLAGNSAALAKLNPKVSNTLTKALAPTTSRFLARHAPAATFYHIGSTRELLDHVIARALTLCGTSSRPTSAPNVVAFPKSVGRIRSRGPCWIEGSRWPIHSEVTTFGGHNVLTGWPRDAGVPTLTRGECLTWLPVDTRQWALLRYHIDDDFKVPLASLPKSKLAALASRCGSHSCLYESPLWQVGSIRQVLKSIPCLAAGRFSLKDLLPRIDFRRVAMYKGNVRRPSRPLHVEVASPPTLPPRTPHARGTVTCTAPVRIDLAGGWTDTPPICNVHGGTVINLAVNLDGSVPVRVSAHRTTTRGWHFHALIDGVAHECRVMPKEAVPAWAKLVPSAVKFTHLIESLDDEQLGVEVSFSSSVPKGSGLGTSSILSAALCAACYALQGKYSPDLLTKHAIAASTLCVEHAIGSGGGWQDQYGALFPGLKSLHTSAGSIQHAECTPLTIGPRLADTFASRTLLYFTGQQRLAANILQNFVNRYLDGDAPTWRTLDRLRKNVLDVREAIDRDDPAAFARHITMYWLLKRSIDPSTTNTSLNRLVARVTPHLDGYLFPGAGGGGFLFMIARTTASAKALRRDLTSRPPAPTARFYTWLVSQTPLTVTVS
jgi:galactokinase/mevalonate kinase-like predicted kinase